MSKGIQYVATGEKFINEAETSASSLKKHHPHLEISLVTDDIEQIPEIFDKVTKHKPRLTNHKKAGFHYKIEGIQLSPFDKTIFLDSDTYLSDSISELFELLNHFDLLICQDFWESDDIIYNNKNLIGFIPFNTGVMAFNKNERLNSFFKIWENIYLEGINTFRHDQPAFMQALLASDIQFFVLPTIYNFRPTQNLAIHREKKVKVIHGHLRKKDFEILEKKINNHLSQRVWYAKNQICLSWKSENLIDILKSMARNVLNYFSRLR